MTSRVTRSRAGSEAPQTTVTDFFKTTRKTRPAASKKSLINDDQDVISVQNSKRVIIKKEKSESVVVETLQTKKTRSRARTPSRQAELSTSEVTGSPPKKSKETVVENETTVTCQETLNVISEEPIVQKSALDVLMESAAPTKKKTGPKTVSDLQSRLAAKGAARSIHDQNLKNKAKIVDEHAEMLKSPKKKFVEVISPTKSKAARNLFSPKKVPDYVQPNFNVLKSAEKIQEERDDAHEEEGKRMTAEFLMKSKLTEEVKESIRQRIELPSSYEHLADSFKQVDQIAAIYLGQNRSCVASEVFKNIKNSSGRDFSNDHLAKILHVYPQAYNVEMREQRRAFGQGGKYELEVRPNLVDDLHGYINERSNLDVNEELPLVCPSKLLSPKKSPRKAVPAVPRKPQLDGRIKLDAARQRDRAHVFRHKLTTIVLKHHEEFLESQGLSDLIGMKRMHPLFTPDRHCPDLPKMQLPEPPNKQSSAQRTMKEVLDSEDTSLPSFVKTLINDLKSPLKDSTGASGSVPLSPKKYAEMQAEQKSKGGMSLLERIRAKEAIKKAAEACIDKDLGKRLQRLTLLKDRYVRIVCNHFTSKRAQTMELDNIAKFVQFSSAIPIPISDIVEDLKLMCEVAPMYATEVSLMGKKYLRLTDKNIDAITEIIAEELSKTKEKMDMQKNTHIAQLSLTPRPKAARSLKFH